MHTPMTFHPQPVLLTYAEAAKVLRVSPRTVWTLVAEEELQAVRIGRSVRIPLAAIEEFIRQKSEPKKAKA